MKEPVLAHPESDGVHCKQRLDGVGQPFPPSKSAVALAEFFGSKPCFMQFGAMADSERVNLAGNPQTIGIKILAV